MLPERASFFPPSDRCGRAMTHVGPRLGGARSITTERKSVEHEDKAVGEAVQPTKRDIIRSHAESLAHLMQEMSPSREASLATTKLDEFFFWGSAALTVEEAREAAAVGAGE